MAGKHSPKIMFRYGMIVVGIILVCVFFYHSNTSLSLQENLQNAFSGKNVPQSADFKPDNTGRFLFYTISTGNSDSLLMVAPGGQAMLVDAADADDYPVIESTLKKYGISEISALVASHFDSDHIGSMDEVVENTKVDSVYLSNYKDNTKEYRDLMNALRSKQITPTIAQSGMQFSLGQASVQILNPENKKYEEINNACVVLKVTYGTADFLLTGDMEQEAINGILKNWGSNLNCEVLKCAHHGSRTGTTNDLLKAVRPDIAVIPCGKDNSYGHPHKETLDLLQKYQVKVYRTDKNGDIAILTDGTSIQTYTQQ
ncbi:MAG: ComEC/Rec2 family competence protein [Eubacteriales bacterium]